MTHPTQNAESISPAKRRVDAVSTKPVVHAWTCEACGQPTAGHPTRSERVEEADRVIVYHFHGDC
jgi:hypothetical protein